MKENYRINDSCLNCRFAFIWCEYDEGIQPYCNKNNDRPLCGSTLCKENFDFKMKGEFEKQIDAWDKWEKTHKVDYCGICDLWEKEKECAASAESQPANIQQAAIQNGDKQ